MNDSTAILIGLAVVVVLVASLMFFIIPEPSQRAIVSTDRLDVAVFEFRNSSSWESIEETVRSRIEMKLVNASGIRVYSRAQLDALLAEQMLGQAGLVDAATAVEIGTLTGVNKLVTGTVYGVDTSATPTTVCVEWSDGDCITKAPGTEYSARVFAQIEIVDTATGRIENSYDAFGNDSIQLPAESLFAGYDGLLASAATQVAEQIESAFSATYTREIRYGLYGDVRPKREGYIGSEESQRFTPEDGEIHLIVHFIRVQPSDTFDVEWADAAGTWSKVIQDVATDGAWGDYGVDVSSLSGGRYAVRGMLNGIEILEIPFTVLP